MKSFVASAAKKFNAAISPNGEWVAYYSDESGRHEILIERFPERGQKTLVWTGSYDPSGWSPDGRELYFTVPSAQGSGERDMMAARVELTPILRVSAPRRLFSGPFTIARLYFNRLLVFELPIARSCRSASPPRGSPSPSRTGRGW